MALRIRFQYVTGTKLGYSVERLADGLYLDMTDTTFKAVPTQALGILAESASPYQGLFRATLSSTPVLQFSNGNYAITIHNTGAGNQVVAVIAAQMISGDDNSVVSSSGSSTPVDVTALAKGVWDYTTSSVSLVGSVGQLLKDNIDAKVSSRSTYTGVSAGDVTTLAKGVWDYTTSNISLVGSVGQLVKDNIDAKVSTRSTYTGVSAGDVTTLAKGVWDYTTSSVSQVGSVGQLVKDNLDAKVSSRSTYTGGAVTVDVASVAKGVWDYTTSNISLAGSVGQLVKDNIDAKLSTRSTFAGGAVLSVTQPVTVGTNQDKTGYLLDSRGLDAVVVEPGVNIRQAISPILAATAGVISGASTGLITIKAGNNSATRILATTDNSGNRTSVILTLPA